MALLYFILGILFTYMAIQNAQETIWNPITILLAVVATIDFAVGFRYLRRDKNRPKN